MNTNELNIKAFLWVKTLMSIKDDISVEVQSSGHRVEGSQTRHV